MPHLHMKGVDVVVDLLDAAEHIDRLSEQELKTLLLDASEAGCSRRRREPGPAPISDAVPRELILSTRDGAHWPSPLRCGNATG